MPCYIQLDLFNLLRDFLCLVQAPVKYIGLRDIIVKGSLMRVQIGQIFFSIVLGFPLLQGWVQNLFLQGSECTLCLFKWIWVHICGEVKLSAWSYVHSTRLNDMNFFLLPIVLVFVERICFLVVLGNVPRRKNFCNLLFRVSFVHAYRLPPLISHKLTLQWRKRSSRRQFRVIAKFVRCTN